MISKGRDYNQTQAFGASNFKTLPKGGYVCRIIQIEETKDKNGNPMIHFLFDICDGEYTGYFMNLYQSRKKSSEHPLDVKFPFEGQMWIPTQDYEDPSKTSRKFKGFCTALEDSGVEVWGMNGEFLMQNIPNKEIGIIYQNQEQEYQGKTSWRVRPWACRSVEAIESEDYFIPDDKPLPKQASNYGSYGVDVNTTFSSMLDSFSAAADDIPF